MTCDECGSRQQAICLVCHACAPMPNEWISVKEKLPNPTTSPVQCIAEDKGQHIAYWCEDAEEWFAGGWESCCYCGGRSKIRFKKIGDHTDKWHVKFATHWMPFPKPPAKEYIGLLPDYPRCNCSTEMRCSKHSDSKL